MNELAKKLRRTRESKGLTIKEQAERFSISAGTLARLEQGKTDVSVNTVERIAIALGVTVWHVVKLLKSA
jgi:transcriptional regulator with XRE-family HTH domain